MKKTVQMPGNEHAIVSAITHGKDADVGGSTMTKCSPKTLTTKDFLAVTGITSQHGQDEGIQQGEASGEEELGRFHRQEQRRSSSITLDPCP